MALFQSNYTIGIARGTYNAGTKQTGIPAPVAGLAAVPVQVQDIGQQIMESGGIPQFDLKFGCDPIYDIRDGDLMTGYNPTNSSVPSILRVQNVTESGKGTPNYLRVFMVKVLRQPGTST